MAPAVIAIAGSSGLIGSALVSALRATDHRVLRIVRRAPSNSDELFWNPDTGEFDAERAARRGRRGQPVRRQRRRQAVVGRVQTEPARQPDRPHRGAVRAAVAEAGVPVLVNASAVGYYGDTRDRIVDETAPPGAGFLAQLCVDWEAATAPRAAMPASGWCWRAPGWCWRRAAGCWAGCKPLFSLGLGARLGNGRQYMPWISLEDEVRALLFAIYHDELSGPVNLTGPAPVTNAEFTAALGRAVNRPTPLMVPGFALRTLLGEFADEGLLGGQRAIPAALERAGFGFHHNTIGEALALRDDDAHDVRNREPDRSGPAADTDRRAAAGHRRLPDRLAAAARARRRPGRRRPGHPAAARAPAVYTAGKRTEPHERPVRRHARRRHRPRRQDHLARPRPAGRLSDHRPGRAAGCGEFRSAP